MTARFFKTSSELTYYLCWILLFTGLLAEEGALPYFIPGVILLISALVLNISDLIQKSRPLSISVKIIGSALPAFLLIRKPTLLMVPVVLVPWFYYMFVYYKERQETDYESFIREFKFLSCSLVAFPIIAIFVKDSKAFAISAQIIPWLLMFFGSAILTTQSLRWRGTTQGKNSFEKRQFIDLSVYTVAALLLSMTDILSRINSFIFYRILAPFFTAVIGIFNILIAKFVYGIYDFLMNFKVEREQVVEIENRDPEVEYEFKQLVEDAMAEKQLEEGDPIKFSPWILVVLFIILVLIFFLTRTIKKRTLTVGIETREIIDVPREEKKHKKKTSADTLRTLYAKHMKRVSLYKHLRISDTTDTIRNNAVNAGLHEANEEDLIREKYRKARYADVLSKEDLKEVKKILK